MNIKLSVDEVNWLLKYLEEELPALYSFIDCDEGELAQQILMLENLKKKIYIERANKE